MKLTLALFICFFLACSCSHITPKTVPDPVKSSEPSQEDLSKLNEEIERLLKTPAPYTLEPDMDQKPADWVNFVPQIESFDHPVDEEMDEALKVALDRAERDGAKDIVWVFSTSGGLLDSGSKIVQMMERSPVKVHCVIDGRGMSAGFYILQGCFSRHMTERSVLMVHEASLGLQEGFRGTRWAFEDLAKNLEVMNHAMAVEETRYSNLKTEELEAKIKGFDWFMGSDEALKNGFVDSVLSDADDEAVLLRSKTNGSGQDPKP
jgi:ATP-dependent protease ClpP protease subunit